MKRIWKWLVTLSLALTMAGCTAQNDSVITKSTDEPVSEQTYQKSKTLVEDGYYYDLEDVILYLDEYNHLPDNYITKKEAQALGWEGGPVGEYLEGAAIGGDRFGNREGLLPENNGRKYTEADIDTDGASSRGAKRLVFSNDGLYYYTDDHYESFTEYIVDENGEVVPV